MWQIGDRVSKTEPNTELKKRREEEGNGLLIVMINYRTSDGATEWDHQKEWRGRGRPSV